MNRFQAHPVRSDERERQRPARRRVQRRVASVLAIAGLMTAAIVSTVSAHEVSGIQVDCEAKQLVVNWIKFGGEGDRLMTVTATGYSESFLITTDSGSHAFTLPPNGPGSVDWENSGDFGPVAFSVDCAAPSAPPSETPSASPTPTEPPPSPSASVGTATGTPHKTPPGTDTEPVTADPALGWNGMLVIGGLALVAAGVLETSRRGRRAMDRLAERIER